MTQDTDAGNRKPFNDKLEEETPPRRLLLRGALAAGWGLLLPGALFGCDSRKDAGPTGAAPTGAPATGPDTSTDAGADAAAPVETGKVTQASVQYQNQPKDGQKCDGCLHFIAESTSCKLVEGPISPEGWCTLWAEKA